MGTDIESETDTVADHGPTGLRHRGALNEQDCELEIKAFSVKQLTGGQNESDNFTHAMHLQVIQSGPCQQ